MSPMNSMRSNESRYPSVHRPCQDASHLVMIHTAKVDTSDMASANQNMFAFHRPSRIAPSKTELMYASGHPADQFEGPVRHPEVDGLIYGSYLHFLLHTLIVILIPCCPSLQVLDSSGFFRNSSNSVCNVPCESPALRLCCAYSVLHSIACTNIFVRLTSVDCNVLQRLHGL